VETAAREVRSESSSAGGPAAAAHLHFNPPYGPIEFTPSIQFAAPVRIRLGLQQRAAANLHNHVLRSVRRFAVLLVADLASFYVMRELVRAVRDYGWLGDRLAARLQDVLPQGILNGWQYAAALFVALFVTGNYGRGDQRRDTRRLFIACALATALPLWMRLWTRGLEPVIVQYAITTVLVWAGLVTERRVIDQIVVRFFPRYRNAAPTLFVGPAEACRDAIQSPTFALGGECRPVGFVDVHLPPAPDALGHAVDFRSLLQRTGAEVVVVAGYLPDNRFREVVAASLEAQSQLLSVPRSIAIAGVQPDLVWRRGQPLIALTAPTLKGWQHLLKRLMDVLGATLGLVVLSPVFALVAAAVKLESRGPVLFGQRRLGRNGDAFKCLKFRSMRPDAEERLRSDPALYAEYVANDFKLPENQDPRLTVVGQFLRRTSLDELPQLLNVLRGEMSLVGPRPIVPEELDLYGHGAPIFLSLKPGMTGAWQVNGRSRVGYPLRVDIELEYVRNWSLSRDLGILFGTIPVVLARRGAH